MSLRTAYNLAFSILVSLWSPLASVAGEREAVVSGEAEFFLPADMSEKEGRRVVLEQARVNALASEFGTFVSSSAMSSAKAGRYGDEETFVSLSMSDIAGVWVKTLSEDVERSVQGRDIVLTARVKGKARSREIHAAEYAASVGRVGSAGEFVPATVYRDGERFDISFETPEDGWLAIYCSDGKSAANRLLPAPDANLAAPLKVRRGEKYRFFRDMRPVMALAPDEDMAVLRFTFLFLPAGKKPLVLPMDEMRTDAAGDVQGFDITQTAYRQWLAKVQSTPGLQRRDIDIKIER